MINTRIGISLMSIVAALAMAGGAAFAAFSSSASNDGNTFGAGSLTLSINTQSPTSTGVFTITNAAPGDVETGLLVLKNEGSVDANGVSLLGIDINGGTLAPVLIMSLYLDNNGDGLVDGGDTLLAGPAPLDNPGWTNYSLPGFGGLSAGASKRVLAEIEFDQNANNSFQGQTINFDLNFQASQ